MIILAQNEQSKSYQIRSM